MGILALGAGSFAVVQIMTVAEQRRSRLLHDVLPLYVYQKAFRDGQAGYAPRSVSPCSS